MEGESGLYLNDVRKLPLLTAEQQVSLARRIERKDAEGQTAAYRG